MPSRLLCLVFLATSVAFAQTTQPIVTLYAPSLAYSNGNNGAEYYGDGPVHIVAGATSLDCVGGISAFVIYTADNQVGYESYSSYIDVQLPLTPAFYQMDIKAFDNCGGSSSVVLATYLQSSTGTVTVNRQGQIVTSTVTSAVPPSVLHGIARDVLSNPVIENYRIETLD